MPAAIAILGGLAVLLVLYRLSLVLSRRANKRSVGLVVLGDIGRSPRMLYHAESLVRNGYTTYIVAYSGSCPPRTLTESPHCHFVYLSQPLPWTAKLPRIAFLLSAPLKVALGALSLLHALLFRIPHAPSFFFVQNPPSIPTLPIVQLAAFLRTTRLIIDWHNTGYSVLGLRLGPEHPAVKIAKVIETYFGRKAFAHLTVTETMRRSLAETVPLEGRTIAFHDRPPRHFRRQTSREAHELFSRLAVLKTISLPSDNNDDDPSEEGGLDDELALRQGPTTTVFTKLDSSRRRRNRPALVVTSTSHTPDEDLDILIDALETYELEALSSRSGETNTTKTTTGPLPNLVMLVTGKGDGRVGFEARVEASERRGTLGQVCQVRTAWLELDDYPKLLGSADVGISLHTSTSGMDLPMKVVDMFGCRLPVLALDFACIGELVQDGINGRTFRTSRELARHLCDLLGGFPFEPSTTTTTDDQTAAFSRGGGGGGGGTTNKLDQLTKGIETARYGIPPSSRTYHVDDDEQGGEAEEEEEEEDVKKKRGSGSGSGFEWTDWEVHWDRIVLPLLEEESR